MQKFQKVICIYLTNKCVTVVCLAVNTERVITMGEKTFNLTWNNHLANLSGLFEGLYKSGSLTDTTLACQGGMLRAHRLVLAACSPYFERVFKEHYGEQPILILKGKLER